MLMQRIAHDAPLWARSFSRAGLFDDVFENAFTFARSAAVGPRFSSRPTDGGWMLSAEVPGMSADDIHVSIDNGVLSVRGEQKREAREGYRWLLQERSEQRFAARFDLSDQMDSDAIEATVEDGLLMIRIPLHPERQPRRIPVSTR